MRLPSGVFWSTRLVSCNKRMTSCPRGGAPRQNQALGRSPPAGTVCGVGAAHRFDCCCRVVSCGGRPSPPSGEFELESSVSISRALADFVTNCCSVSGSGWPDFRFFAGVVADSSPLLRSSCVARCNTSTVLAAASVLRLTCRGQRSWE